MRAKFPPLSRESHICQGGWHATTLTGWGKAAAWSLCLLAGVAGYYGVFLR